MDISSKTFILLTSLLLVLSVVSDGAWFEFEDKEYFVSAGLGNWGTWHEARQWCMGEGGDLATLSNAEVTGALMEKANDTQVSAVRSFWIGYNKIMKSDFSWSNGAEGIQENWAAGFPKEYTDYACAYVIRDSQGDWYNGRCAPSQQWGYFCQRDINDTSPKTDPPTPQVPGFCPQGHFGVGNKCFRVYVPDDTSPGWTWHESLTLCGKGPGHLPTLCTIHSEQEAWAALSGLKDKKAELWLGLRREYSGEEFRWVNNDAMTYENWDSKSTDDDRCGYMLSSGSPPGWRDGGCGGKRGVLCQTFKDPNLVISTPPTTQFPCPSGYTRYWYGCYRYVDANATWQEALDGCSQEGSSLLSIHYESELAAIQTFITTLKVKNEYEWAWLGLHYQEFNEKYSWTDNSLLIYTNWPAGEPDREMGGGCVAMNENGQWFDHKCDNVHPYFCKYSVAPPITTPKHTEGECPLQENDGWIPHGSYCYLVKTDKFTDFTFSEALDGCLSRGGTLASIDHLYLNNMLYRETVEDFYELTLWIGFHEGKTGTFQWVDNSPVEFVNWKVGDSGEGQCAVFLGGSQNNGEWIQEDCNNDEIDGYICKIEKDLPGTPPDSDGRCPDEEWEGWENHCYLFKPNTLNLIEDASKTCTSRGGDLGGLLVSIMDVHENRYVSARLHELDTLPGDTRTYWLGLQWNSQNRMWHWQDGSRVVYTNWETAIMGEDCAEIDSNTGEWDPVPCDKSLGFVCKSRRAPAPEEEVDKPDEPQVSDGLSGGQIAGVVVGALAVVLAFVIINAIFVRRYKRQVANSVGMSRRTSVSSGGSGYSNTSGTSKRTLAP